MKKLLTLLCGIILLAGCQQQISPEEQAFNQSGRAKAIETATDLWQFYDDSEAGFNLKYPHNVSLKADADFQLTVEVKPIAHLANTMGFTEETALKNQAALAKGKFGEEVDWPLRDSEQVVNLGNFNAQDFLVLARFDVCDVSFQRKLVLYPNDYQVVISLTAPREKLVLENYGYFTTNPENCGEQKIWDFDKQDDFYEELAAGRGSKTTQEWFDTFDAIVSTIEFPTAAQQEKAIDNLEALQGMWTSVTDEKAAVEFSGDKKTDFYAGQEMSVDYFKIDGDSIIINGGVGTRKYTIVELSSNSLTLTHLPRGNTLEYKR